VKLLPLLLALIACQSDSKSEPKPAAVTRNDAAYKADIQKLCDSMSLSGADKLDKLERVAPHAKWLGENLGTRDAQMFLIGIKPLKGEAYAQALEAEAKRVGLTAGCALANEFR
jgi:hypothetical protein